MVRSLTLTAFALALIAGLSLADPAINVRYERGVPIIQLAGNYASSHYTIYRGTAPERTDLAITDDQALCMGDCYAIDFAAEPGRTYWYRFDLNLADGRYVSFGPYAVTIAPGLAYRVSVAIRPNPGRGPARVDLSVAAGPGATAVAAEATLFDVRGRVVSTLHRGPLAAGVTTIPWDGRDREGGVVAPGLYFLRLSTPIGAFVARVVRIP
jgi:hypothetical protein